jgi:hypothetical protein
MGLTIPEYRKPREIRKQGEYRVAGRGKRVAVSAAFRFRFIHKFLFRGIPARFTVPWQAQLTGYKHRRTALFLYRSAYQIGIDTFLQRQKDTRAVQYLQLLNNFR